jgi:hypothetical protein
MARSAPARHCAGAGCRLDQPDVLDLLDTITAEGHPTKLELNLHRASARSSVLSSEFRY